MTGKVQPAERATMRKGPVPKHRALLANFAELT